MATTSISNQKTLQQIIDDSAKTTQDRNTGELGKDDFLNLLVTQLKYQDPLKPVDDKEFIGQMAQFSALEQMQNMNTSMSQSQGFSMIGKHVKASLIDEKTKEVQYVEGDVTSVKVDKGKTYLVVKDKDIPIERVTDVTEGTRSSGASNIAQYTHLIGYRVDGAVYDSSTANVVPVTGVVKSVERGVYEDYAVMDGVQVEISDVGNNSTSTSPNYRKNYLTDNQGGEVIVTVVNRDTEQKVLVKAILKDFAIADDGKITATLDRVGVPVESISTVTPVDAAAAEE